ncbi:MAG TPA: hypothetical protein VMU27_01535, partial [Candidatus Paceibacterota bacterium]|nr:hypothetical protein [Candidatus Paceibacterota bacterium]
LTRAAIGCNENPPQPSATLNVSPDSGSAPLTAAFSTSGSQAENGSINFGDGNSIRLLTLFGNGTTNSAGYCSAAPDFACYAPHTYTSAGTYAASVTNSSGNTIATHTITVTGGSASNTSCKTSGFNCLSAKPTSGRAPLTVTFTTTYTLQGAYTMDFGDGTKSGSLQSQGCNAAGACTYSITHTYQSNGIFNTTLDGPYGYSASGVPSTAVVGYASIVIGGGGSAPQLTFITPPTLAFGAQATLNGSGFLAKGDEIILDGKYLVANVASPTSDTVQTFTVPTYVTDMNACKNLPPYTTCDPAAIQLPAGQHSVVVQNANGTSNPLTFTVTPFTGTASVDQSALSQSSGNPTLSGSASGVSQIQIEFVVNQIGYTTNAIPVSGGRWSVQLLSDLNPGSSLPGFTIKSLPPGSYKFNVYDVSTGLTLTNGTLLITSDTSIAAINPESLSFNGGSSSAVVTISGTAVDVPYVRVYMQNSSGTQIYDSGTIAVSDDDWSTVASSIPPGTYNVEVYGYGNAAGTSEGALGQLATGTFQVQSPSY